MREAFQGYSLRRGEPFSKLRSENSVIDRFFEQRENDPQGGEGGKRIVQVRSRPVFDVTFGRTRAATWFDIDHPPQGIVWLLDAALHDERHKGTSDAYDLFEQLDIQGRLFPVEADYLWLELDRRRLDTEKFGDDARRDALRLLVDARQAGRASGTLASVPTRFAWEHLPEDLPTLYAAVSIRAVTGSRSGYEFPLTQERFLLVAEAVRQAGEALLGPQVLVDELFAAPAALAPLHDERAFIVVFERG